MKNKIKAICLSKTNILSVSFSIFLFLKDIKEVITGFASHLFLIGISIIVLIGLLLINLFLTKSKNNEIPNQNHWNQNFLNYFPLKIYWIIPHAMDRPWMPSAEATRPCSTAHPWQPAQQLKLKANLVRTRLTWYELGELGTN